MPKRRLPDKIRKAVYSRDDWKCRHCGRRDGLHPHHVSYQSAGGEHVENNLLTLCARCHGDIHDGRIKLEIVCILEHDLIVKFWKQKGWKP
jgi:5-methylcytosine-specific restriction endonuclease McrA